MCVGKNMKKLEPFALSVGMLKWYSHYGRFHKNLKVELLYIPAIPLYRVFITNNLNQDVKELFAFPCSLQHY